MALRERAKIILVSALIPVVVYLGLLNLADRSSWRTPYDQIEWRQTQKGLVVQDLENPELVTNIKPGSRLLHINGIPVSGFDEYVEVLELLTAQGEEEITADYTFVNQDRDAELTLPVQIELRSQLQWSDAPIVSVAFLYLAIGLFVLYRNSRAKGALHFCLLCLVAFILMLMRYSGHADAFDLTIYWFSAVALLLLPPLFLHFCYGFVRSVPGNRGETAFLAGLYLPAAILLTVHILWFLGLMESVGLPRTPSISRSLDKIELIHLLTYFGLAVVTLISARMTASSFVKKQQIRWILGGTTTGFIPFCLIYGVPFLLDLKIEVWMEASVLFLGLIPLSFGYAIGKYRLPDVDLILRRGATYVIASSAVLAFFVGITLLVAQTVLVPGSGIVWTALIALAVAFMFGPLRERI
jgi:hypothetical protein